MAYFLIYLRDGLEVQDQVDGSQLPILTYKDLGPQQIIKSYNVGQTEPGRYLPLVCKNGRGAKHG